MELSVAGIDMASRRGAPPSPAVPNFFPTLWQIIGFKDCARMSAITAVATERLERLRRDSE
jgi:hypothetical protein